MLNLPELDEEFDQLLTSSLVSIYLGFDLPDADLPADGTGFIVSQKSDLLCNACTWTSRKWAHTSRKDNLLVRLFYKSSNPSYAQLKDLTETELTEVALSDIQKSLGIDAKPVSVEVTGWKNLMPNYTMQHKTAVSALEDKMAKLVPNVKLAGASFYGVGIGACIQNGKDLAEEIAESILGEK